MWDGDCDSSYSYPSYLVSWFRVHTTVEEKETLEVN